MSCVDDMSVTCLSHVCLMLVICLSMFVTCTQALDSALEDENKELFFEVATACDTVICCR